jgi:kumamolisin
VFLRKSTASEHIADHQTFGYHYGVDENVVTQFRNHLASFNTEHLTSIEETLFHPHRRVMRIKGCPKDLAKFFEVELHTYESLDTADQFMVASKEPKLHTGVVAVLGLDKRKRASSYINFIQAAASFDQADSFAPAEVAHLYKFPDGTDGTGQCVAVIELGGGYTQSNLNEYFAKMGVRAPPMVDVSVLGAKNNPGSGADSEVQLDIEVLGCCAPGAKQAVYFADNTDQGFFEAISMAAHDVVNKPSVISISWGGPEDEWSAQAVNSVNTALEDAAKLGLSITVASGDNGAADRVTDGKKHCDFPSSSPFVLSCGGTTLVAPQGRISLETVWNKNLTHGGATGGGISNVFPMPAWQAAVVNAQEKIYNLSGRGVPDVSGDGDPATGYQVEVNGQMQVVGGTSAVAPLWAALIARMNQSLGKTLPQIQELLYTLPSGCFRDVTSGNNAGYSAALGWDPTTGLGSPDGTAILNAIKSTIKT